LNKRFFNECEVAAGKRISQEEGNYSLMPSSTMLRLHSAEGCVDVVISVFSVTSTPGVAVAAWIFMCR
jgi:hypothetical protein